MLRMATIPSLLLSGTAQTSIGLGQTRLLAAQKELSTGRHFDMGLTLGSRTGSSIALRVKLDAITQAHEAAAQASVEAGVVQSTLSAMGDVAANFLSTLAGARGADHGQDLIRTAATSALQTFTDLVNTTFGGQYLFGGINTDIPPLVGYVGGAPQAAIDGAFLSAFGMTQDDANVSQITGPDMASFIAGGLESVFTPAAWSMNWSPASATSPLQRMGDGGQVDIRANANAPFVRHLAQAFSMMVGLGQGNLSAAAFEQTVNEAMSMLSSSQLELGHEQSRIGIAQQSLNLAAQSSDKMKIAVTQAISALESVDPYEAATRVNTLMTQLESSYAITGRISRMSLLNYI
jgi:flagellar hook-associated protein 3 FlgL